jgi:hypothetical protein
MTCLYRFTCADVTLAACLAESFSATKLHGLLQAPGEVRLIAWPGLEQEGADALLPQVYEARLFNAHGELRWLRNPESAGTGSAAWITDAEATAPAGFSPIESLTELEIRDDRILSYGNDFPGADIPGGLGGYRVREYIGRAPDPAGADGNRIVVEQRVFGILTPEEAIEVPRDEGVES